MRQINIVKILLGIVGMVGMLTSCYDDKGNYDYRDIPKLEIVSSSGRYFVALNSEIKIEPEIIFPDGQEQMNLSYAWILEGQLISTERVLVWVADRYTEESGYNLLFEVKDEDNNLVFRTVFSLDVVEPYEMQGYFVLAKKDGKVLVHQIREENSETDKKAFSTLQDIYRMENGEELSGDAFKLSEMYALNKGTANGEIMRQMMFVAPQQSNVVETPSFKKAEYGLQEMFGGAYPGGFSGVANVIFGEHLDLVIDKEGKLYPRYKESNEFFFHSGSLFYARPMSFEEEELSGIQYVPGHITAKYNLLYDSHKRRLLVIWDYYDYYASEGDIKYQLGKIEEVTSNTVDGLTWPADVPTVEEAFQKYDVVHIASTRSDFNDYGTVYYFAVLKDPKTGKLYHYEFALEKEYGKPVLNLTSDDGKTVAVIFKELTGDAAKVFGNPNSIIHTLPSSYLGYGANQCRVTLIAVGKNLYAYNREGYLPGEVMGKDDEGNDMIATAPNPELKGTFDSEIGVMTGINGTLYWGELLGLVMKNGVFECYSLANVQYPAWNKQAQLQWRTPDNVDLGDPLDIFFSYDQGFDWK